MTFHCPVEVLYFLILMIERRINKQLHPNIHVNLIRYVSWHNPDQTWYTYANRDLKPQQYYSLLPFWERKSLRKFRPYARRRIVYGLGSSIWLITKALDVWTLNVAFLWSQEVTLSLMRKHLSTISLKRYELLRVDQKSGAHLIWSACCPKGNIVGGKKLPSVISKRMNSLLLPAIVSIFVWRSTVKSPQKNAFC